MDNLSNKLNICKPRCLIGSMLVNHLMYPGLESPYTHTGPIILKQISIHLHTGPISPKQICFKYMFRIWFWIWYQIHLYNKGNVRIVRIKEDKKLVCVSIWWGTKSLISNEAKHRCHLATCDLSDDADIAYTDSMRKLLRVPRFLSVC